MAVMISVSNGSLLGSLRYYQCQCGFMFKLNVENSFDVIEN